MHIFIKTTQHSQFTAYIEIYRFTQISTITQPKRGKNCAVRLSVISEYGFGLVYYWKYYGNKHSGT